MAFTQGQLITASELNSINGLNTHYNAYGDGYGDHSGSTPWTYCRGSSGRFLHIHMAGTGLFPQTRAYLYKKDSPTGASVQVWSSGNQTGRTNYYYDFHLQNYGEGWFYVACSGSRGWHKIYFYCGQKDCQQGKLLTYWDEPRNSSNRIPGTSLTTSVLNSGRAGTIN